MKVITDLASIKDCGTKPHTRNRLEFGEQSCVVGMGSKRQVVLNDDTSVECSERLIGVRLFRQL